MTDPNKPFVIGVDGHASRLFAKVSDPVRFPDITPSVDNRNINDLVDSTLWSLLIVRGAVDCVFVSDVSRVVELTRQEACKAIIYHGRIGPDTKAFLRKREGVLRALLFNNSQLIESSELSEAFGPNGYFQPIEKGLFVDAEGSYAAIKPSGMLPLVKLIGEKLKTM